MILTDAEMRELRGAIEEQAGLEPEILHRCGHLIRVGAFDEAVRSAFVLLEERLRKALGVESMTGAQLVNHAFNPAKGVLAKQLGHTQPEREGLRELYSGAFRLFRNPTAHGVVGYSPGEGKAIVGLVDLMLKIVKRAGERLPDGIFTENLEAALELIEQAVGAGAVSRLRAFLGRLYTAVGLKSSTDGVQWVPLRRHCLYKADDWDQPKAHAIAVFYVIASGKEYGLRFATDYYYKHVVGFDVARLTADLTNLGFWPKGVNQEPCLDLKVRNDQEFFAALFEVVIRTVDELDATLQQAAG